MALLQRLTHDLKAGLARLRYGTVHAAHRALEETELLQLRLESRKLDSRIEDLYGDVGDRALDLHERGESTERILADPEVMRGIEQVLALRAERSKLLSEMDEIRGGDGAR
ncbi:MAG TPA: hypothetical protein VL329_03095 [Nitrospiraceae bacterium]|nr:hypothetical protein [Nitrospiraceae bacterium]